MILLSGKYKPEKDKALVKKERLKIPVVTDEPKDSFDRTDLLLNSHQMSEENYPLPLDGMIILFERKLR